MPYAEYGNDMLLIRAITEGVIPTKPVNFTKWPYLRRCLWDIAEDCWTIKPKIRPSMKEIVILLKELMNPKYKPMPQEVGEFQVLNDAR